MYFQYVNKRDAHVKIDRDSHRCRPGASNSLIPLVVGWLSTTGGFERKSLACGSISMIFQYFYKIFVPRSEGPPLSSLLPEHGSITELKISFTTIRIDPTAEFYSFYM